jgi:hypothetical protein
MHLGAHRIRSIPRLVRGPIQSQHSSIEPQHLNKSRTATTYPSLTNNGSFFPLALRPYNLRASSSVAVSTPLKGMRFALRIVSMRDVAVMMCDEPAVSEVKR